jgi:predicted Zn-dependent protease
MSHAKVEDFESYSAAKLKRRQVKQRLLSAVSIVCFIGTVIPATAHLFIGGNSNQPNNAAQVPSQQTLLQQQEQGYMAVLKREPNNETALEGLMALRLQRQDFKGAEELLAKLVKLNPDRKDLQALLAQIKQRQAAVPTQSKP